MEVAPRRAVVELEPSLGWRAKKLIKILSMKLKYNCVGNDVICLGL